MHRELTPAIIATSLGGLSSENRIPNDEKSEIRLRDFGDVTFTVGAKS